MSAGFQEYLEGMDAAQARVDRANDARKLKRWWSAHTTGQFAIRPCPENPRFKALYRIQ